ncbi:MAG: NrfD/PsrC family molybdoenzyme membrane anchor subunit [Solirubrobacterales bacterium]
MTSGAGGSDGDRGDVERAVPEESTYVHGGTGPGPRTTQATRTKVGERRWGRRREGGERAMVPREEPRSYYGRPVIKPPIWTWEIPTYFFTGGLGGASAAFAWAAERSGNRELARNSWLIALGGISVSPLLLTADLGKPMRFIYMLRVFKVTSPMNVGSWLLTLAGLATAPAASSAILGFPGGRLGRAAPAASGALGLSIATYTAVLISNTAVPIWSEARWELPLSFAASAAASAGAAAALATPPELAAPARRLAIGGAVVESAMTELMERRLGELGEPYREGASGKLAKAAKALTVAGGALMATGAKRSRPVVATGAACLLAGSFCERWAVYKAGFASANDPKYTVGPQGDRLQNQS